MTWLGKFYIWATYRLYDEFAWAYDFVSWLVSLGRWSGWQRSALGHVRGWRVLELGFGTGELLSEAAARGLDLVGLDASVAMHRVARRKLSRFDIDVPRVLAIAQAMPFPDECFDTIVCTFPAAYILHPATFDEVIRVLRRADLACGEVGGRLVVAGLVVWVDLPVCRWAQQFFFGVQGETVLEQFVRVARTAGLQVDVQEPGDGPVRVPVVIAERVVR